jgi:sugar-phosphatase
MKKTKIQSALFDLDGTLANSEVLTDESITWVMRQYGIEKAFLPPYESRGRSWNDVVDSLLTRYSLAVDHQEVAQKLMDHWNEKFKEVELIPGAIAALVEAARHYQVAIVSSSPHDVIVQFARRNGVSGIIPEKYCIGADEVDKPKPYPEGFLLAAKRMQVNTSRCIVFEDSRAGLEAAHAAGMASLAILEVCAEPDLCRELADECFQHYNALPDGFWTNLAQEGPTAVRKSPRK